MGGQFEIFGKGLTTWLYVGLQITLAVAIQAPSPAWALDWDQALDGRIIRSLAVDPADPQRILVGLKSSEAGGALVLESRDGGVVWSELNGGQSLSPNASDVQAVAIANGGDGQEVILAGTWQQGLYLSNDQGATFRRVDGFPSPDIRDLRSATLEDGEVVYAATARHGIFESRDGGARWQALGPGEDFFWSLSLSPDGHDLYAVSLEAAVYRRRGSAGAWQKIFDRQNAYALAQTADTVVIATEAGAYLSIGPKQNWRTVPGLETEKVSSALFAALDQSETLLLGSWSDGLIQLDPETGNIVRFLEGTPIVHLAQARDRLLIATWGHGLKVLDLKQLVPK